MTSLEQMRGRLAEMRAAGVEFAVAWPIATEDMPRLWHETLRETRSAWEQAYGGCGPHALADAREMRQAAADGDGTVIRVRSRMRLVA